MTFKDAVGIFARTFAALAASFLLSFQATVALPGTTVEDKATVLGLGLLAAGVGSLLAVAIAYRKSQATTALGKALRAFVEKLTGGLAVTVAFATVGDVVEFWNLVVPLTGGAAVAFVVTLLSYAAPPAVEGAPEG